MIYVVIEIFEVVWMDLVIINRRFFRMRVVVSKNNEFKGTKTPLQLYDIRIVLKKNYELTHTNATTLIS